MAASAAMVALRSSPPSSILFSCSSLHYGTRPTRTSSASALATSFKGLQLGSLRDRTFSVPDGKLAAKNHCLPTVCKLKMKTRKAVAKRFKVTGSGLIIRRRAGKQHLLQKKTRKRKNRLSQKALVDRRDYDNIIGAMPYMKVRRRPLESRRFESSNEQ